MIIGVIADTHSKELPAQMLKDFKTVDLIIHAGDFCSLEDYKKLAKLQIVEGVYGNMDDGAIRKLFPRRQILKVEDFKVGIFHGEGAAEKVLESVRAEFKGDDVDVIIFGHSHHALNERIDGTLYFNPGSPNDEIFAQYQSYGILKFDSGDIKSKIIKVK